MRPKVYIRYCENQRKRNCSKGNKTEIQKKKKKKEGEILCLYIYLYKWIYIYIYMASNNTLDVVNP